MRSVPSAQLTIVFPILVICWTGTAAPGDVFCDYICKQASGCPGSRCLTNLSSIPSCENLYRVFPAENPYTLYSVQDMSKYSGVYRIPCGGPVFPIGTFIGLMADPFDPNIKDMIRITMKFDHYSRGIDFVTMEFYGEEVYRDTGIGYATSGNYITNFSGFHDREGYAYFNGSQFFFSQGNPKQIHAYIPAFAYNETMVKQ